MSRPEGSREMAVPGGPTVTVVIPAHNVAAYLAECLDSVAAQEGTFTLEIVVVDDGSTDGTADVARSYDSVMLIEQPNRGPSAARNAGIAATHGEFVAFLDADDLWPAGKLARQLEVLQSLSGAGLVFGDCRQFDESGVRAITEFKAAGLGADAWGAGSEIPNAYARLLENNFITTGSVVMRRAVLTDIGGFAEDLRLVEDLDLWLRVALVARIAWCNEISLLRRRHGSNTSRDAEAMSLAYLEVLGRQTDQRWQSPGDPVVSTARLAAREYISLSELALARGNAALALRHARSSVANCSTCRGWWQVARVTVTRLRQNKSLDV